MKIIIFIFIVLFALALIPNPQQFLSDYAPLIALLLIIGLAIGINYKSKVVVTKAPDNVIKITITKDQLQ